VDASPDAFADWKPGGGFYAFGGKPRSAMSKQTEDPHIMTGESLLAF
jgi:hypothetical protein